MDDNVPAAIVRRIAANMSLNNAELYPYDETTPPEEIDWAHKIARGCIAEVSNHSDVGEALDALKIGDEFTTDLVKSIANVIREGVALHQAESTTSTGELQISPEGDFSFTQRIFSRDDAWYSGGSDKPSVTFELRVKDNSQTEGKVSLGVYDDQGRGATATLSLTPTLGGEMLLPVFHIDNGQQGDVLEIAGTRMGLYLQFPETHELRDMSRGDPFARPCFAVSKKPDSKMASVFRTPLTDEQNSQLPPLKR